MELQLEKFIEQNKINIENIFWDSIIEIYTKNIEESNKILNIIENKKEYFEMYNNIKKINKKIENYIFNSLNPTYQIAIIGSIKAGKSTLINSILGIELASVSVTPETAVLTKFRASKKNNINITFYNEDEWNEIWDEAIKKNVDIFLKEYNELNSEEVKKIYLDKEDLYLEFETIDILKQEILKWTSSKSQVHYFVKQIEIGIEKLKLPENIVLVDTPGLNDIIDYRSKITRDYIDSANSVLICVNAKTLRNDEMNTIKEIFKQANYKKNKIFILGTQIDTMNSINDWEIQKKEWIKNLSVRSCYENIENSQKHLIGISSYTYDYVKRLGNNISINDLLDMLKLRLINENLKDILKNISFQNNLTDDESRKIKEKLIEISGINKVKSVIDYSITKNFKKFLIEDFIEKYKILNRELEDLIKDLEKIEEIFEVRKNNNELLKSIEKTNKLLKDNKRHQDIKNVKVLKIDNKKIEENFKKLRKNIDKI